MEQLHLLIRKLKEVLIHRVGAASVNLGQLLRNLHKNLWFKRRNPSPKKPGNGSAFVDKAVNQIITAAESAMGEKTSCKSYELITRY